MQLVFKNGNFFLAHPAYRRNWLKFTYVGLASHANILWFSVNTQKIYINFMLSRILDDFN